MSSRIKRRAGSGKLTFRGAYYHVPPIEDSSELETTGKSLLDAEADEIWQLLDDTFASVRTTDARTAEIKNIDDSPSGGSTDG